MWPLINQTLTPHPLCWFDCYLVHVIGDLSQPLLDLLHVLALLLKLNNTNRQSKARRKRGDPPSWMFISIKYIIWGVYQYCIVYKHCTSFGNVFTVSCWFHCNCYHQRGPEWSFGLRDNLNHLVFYPAFIPFLWLWSLWHWPTLSSLCPWS